MCGCDSDYDLCDFQSVTQRRARKPHSCYECGDAIPIGDRYEHMASKWDGGDVRSYSFCLTCVAWKDAFLDEQQRVCGCSGWTLGGFWDAIAEHEDEHGWGGPSLAEQREDEARKRSQFRTMAATP
jgi:hypothetical protein